MEIQEPHRYLDNTSQHNTFGFTSISSCSINNRLVFVLKVVLDVTHLVMGGLEERVGYRSTLLNPIKSITVNPIKDSGLITRVGSLPKDDWLVFVLQVVLDVSHFVMSGVEEISGYSGTLFDPTKRTNYYYYYLW